MLPLLLAHSSGLVGPSVPWRLPACLPAPRVCLFTRADPSRLVHLFGASHVCASFKGLWPYIPPRAHDRNGSVWQAAKAAAEAVAAQHPADGDVATGATATAPAAAAHVDEPSEAKPSKKEKKRLRAEEAAAGAGGGAADAAGAALLASPPAAAAADVKSEQEEKKKKKKRKEGDVAGVGGVEEEKEVGGGAAEQPGHSDAAVGKKKKKAKTEGPAPSVAAVGDADIARSGKPIVKALYHEHPDISRLTTAEVRGGARAVVAEPLVRERGDGAVATPLFAMCV